MKKRVMYSGGILLVLLIFALFILLIKPPATSYCDQNCSIKKLEKIISSLDNVTPSTYLVRYTPSYLYYVDSSTLIGYSYFSGSVIAYRAPPFYVNLSDETSGSLNGSLLDIFNRLHSWDYQVSCNSEYQMNSTYNEWEWVTNCQPLIFNYNPSSQMPSWFDSEVPETENFELGEVGYHIKNQSFYSFDYEGYTLYVGEDIMYYKNYFYKSMGYPKVPAITVVLRGEYNISAANSKLFFSPLVGLYKSPYICGITESNFTVIRIEGGEGGWYCANRILLPKWVDFFDYNFK